MIDLNKKYWFFLFPNTYKIVKGNKLLLYNTQTAQYLQSENQIFLKLIDQLNEKINLGVTYLSDEYLNDKDCYCLIEDSINKKIAGVQEITDAIKKPVLFVPILNLQRDVDKMIANNISFVGDRLKSYLTTINIYINSECDLNCPYCTSYQKQYKCCSKDEKQHKLEPSDIELILEQTQYSSVSKVNILGGNILLYQDWIELKQVLGKYDYEFHFWIYYKNLVKEENALSGFVENDKIDVIVNFPLEEQVLLKLISQHKNHNNLTFHFFVENESHYEFVKCLEDKYPLNNLKIAPFFTGNNYIFFKENIFTDKEDILTEPIMLRKIFCNQKLNSNNFGILNILPNGDVNANMNTDILGNIKNDLLSKIIYEELTKNTAWRKIRNDKPCNDCLYQFLCPPISNYELALGKPNLCHLNP